MLFSDDERTFTGPRPYAEPSYEYLDRSARPEAAAIRQTVSSWYRKYPEDGKADLTSRFKSLDDLQHKSAAFELYLHEIFRRLGCSLVVHPKTGSARATRPDFLVDSGFTKFYLEAVQSIDFKSIDRSAEARMNVVYDTINRLSSENFFIAVDYKGAPNTPPSGRKLRSVLEKWLNSLDPDQVIADVAAQGNAALPTHEKTLEGWELTFTAIPRAPERRNKPTGGIIGVRAGEARYLNTSETIRDSLLAKGARYGELDLPLVVAVNANVDHLDRMDIMEALFGQEQYILRSDSDEPEFKRAPNGFWHGPKQGQFRYRRVSGAIFGFDVHPWTYGVRSLTYYANPYAHQGVRGCISSLPRLIPLDGKMVDKSGRHPRDILNLASPYPGVERNFGQRVLSACRFAADCIVIGSARFLMSVSGT